MSIRKLFRNLILPCIIFLSMSQMIHAQDYKSSIGGKLGTYVAVSFSTYLSEVRSLEVIGGITREANQSNFIFGSFYKYHKDVTATLPPLKWYSGLGLYLTIEKNGDDNNVSVAPSGILGMEYTLENTPVIFFLDVSPYYAIGSISSSKFNLHANLGVRYVLSQPN